MAMSSTFQAQAPSRVASARGSTRGVPAAAFTPARAAPRSVQPAQLAGVSISSAPTVAPRVQQVQAAGRRLAQQVMQALPDGAILDRPLRVAVIGGGPSGACAADTLAQGGVEAYLIERKMDNCKVCGSTARAPWIRARTHAHCSQCGSDLAMHAARGGMGGRVARNRVELPTGGTFSAYARRCVALRTRVRHATW